jgi:hypothetical protein
MSKSISRFEPTPSRDPAECERHYTQVHVPMAQDLLRPMPAVRSYHVSRALAQADIAGGWRARPRAWRFVVLRYAPGGDLAFTPEQAEMVAQDHVNCLYRLRHCDVDERVLLDRRDGQLALAKFVIEADRPHDVDADAAWSAFAELAQRAQAIMEGTVGARLLLLNRALTELATEPVEVEGQRPIGLLAETTRVGYVEAYFDHRRWGEEALGQLARHGGLVSPALADVHLLAVEEEAAIG